MKPKTMILMVVAMTCGLGASYMTSQMIARQDAEPNVPKVPVLVAKARIPSWQPVTEPDKMFEIKMFPADLVPEKAVGRFEDIKDQRLNKPLTPGNVLTQAEVVSKEQADLGSRLKPGQVATAIRVSPESLAGGFVLPDTRVDVICTTRGAESESKYVLQNMLVLAVDTQDTRNPEQRSIVGQTVTLAATPEEATHLALAASVGELRLLLKAHGDNSRVGNVVTRSTDLGKSIGGKNIVEEEPVAVTPAPTLNLPPLPPEEPRATVAAPEVVAPVRKKRQHVMTIWNGSQKDRVIHREGDADEEEEVQPAPEQQPAPKKNIATGSIGGGEKVPAPAPGK